MEPVEWLFGRHGSASHSHELPMYAKFVFSLLLAVALSGETRSCAQTIDPTDPSLPPPRPAMTSPVATLEPRTETLPDLQRLGRERLGRSESRTIPLNIPVDIVTYNVHLLPDIAAKIAGERSQSDYRARTIAEKLANYDIVGICEAFDPNYSKSLIDGLQAKSSDAFYVARGPQRSGRALTHSGLVLLSRYEIEETHTIAYRDASRFYTHGFRADGFAAKGALHARLRLGDDRRSDESSAVVDCFLTHLESRSAAARKKQIDELAAFIAEHSSPDVPMVVLGDFNVAADSVIRGNGAARVAHLHGNSPYRQLRSKLTHNGRQLVDVWADIEETHGGTSNALAPDGGRRLDYIFVSDSRAGAPGRLLPQDVMALPFADKNVPEGSLSDHLAVTCRAEFSTMAEPARR